MDGTALACILHVAGRPSPSHCCHPIVVIQSSSSKRRPRIATVVFIHIIAVGGDDGIIAIPVAISTIAVIAIIAVIVDVHRRCPIVAIRLPSSNQRPRIVAIVIIDIVAVSGSGGIIAAAVAVVVAISAITVVAVVVDVHRPCWRTPLLSHHRCSIAVVQWQSLNAAAVVIDIVTVGGGSIIIVTIAIAVASLSPSPWLSPPLPSLPSSLTLLCRHCFLIVIVIAVLLGSQSEELDQTTPQRHRPWHADGTPTLVSAARGPAAMSSFLEISWCLSDGSWS
jgi:hypothetical protein